MKVIYSAVFLATLSMSIAAQDVPNGTPNASLDLATVDGAKLVNGEWRYSDTRIVEVDFNSAGADNQPSGPAVKTYDYTPKAGGADYDDSTWQKVSAADLSRRRGNGRLSFNWYRISITIPEKVGEFDPTGSTVVFQTVLDDYAEIWVNGEISRFLGQKGGSVVASRFT